MIPSSKELELALLRGAAAASVVEKVAAPLIKEKRLWVLKRTWRKPVKLIDTLQEASILGADELFAEKLEEKKRLGLKDAVDMKVAKDETSLALPSLDSAIIIREQILYAIEIFDSFSDEALCSKKRKLVLEMFL